MPRKAKYRKIEGLRWARPLQERPHCLPQYRAKRGSKAKGVRFEQQVKKAIEKDGLLSVQHGQWFEYEDVNGLGCCQTDLLFAFGGTVYIVECKLSDAEGGIGQVTDLYLPVLRMALPKRTVLGIVCVKGLRSGVKASTVCQELSIAMNRAEKRVPILQYLGRGTIF